MSVYLVTGGAGFIGSHLCDALVARGDTVRVLDDLSTGRRSNLPGSTTFIEGDVADPAQALLALDGVDGCFHLAAIASVEKGVTDWLGTHRTNITGTISVFDAIRRLGTEVPVVYTSSAAVYGDATAIPIAESEPWVPLSAYGADKYGCELHARVASHVHGIPTVGLRFFNVYGARIRNALIPESSPSSASASPPACRLPSSGTANRPAISSTSLTWSEHCLRQWP
jgi:UDP-glucose 4-epimerase